MVAHLVRLKLSLLRNGARRSAWRLVGLVVMGLYALGIVAVLLGGLIVLSTQDAELQRTVVVLGGALAVLGWALIPLVLFGVDATLDPSLFQTFAIPRRQLVAGLALGGLIGIPGVATTLVGLGTVAVWWHAPAAVLAALVGAVIGIATCVVVSRAVTTGLSSVASGRRFRELAAVLIVVPLVLAGPIVQGVGAGIGAVSDALPGVARVVGWTPVGAAWALGADVADGQWLAAAAKLVIALGTLLVLLLVWDRSLQAALVRPPGAGHSVVRSVGLGLLGRLPATPTGAVAARCLTYWIRDPRYAAAVAVVPLMPVLIWFMSGGGSGMLAVGPVVAFLMGWSISADVAYDSSAFWTHVAAPVSGRVDRAGRAWAGAVLGVPATVVLTLVSLAIAGRWDVTVPVLAMSLGVLLTAIGVSSVYSARVIYPVPKPGDSPFSNAQGGSFATVVSQFAGWAAVLALCVPTVGVGIVAAVTGSALLAVLGVVVSVGLGALFLVLGLRMGGRIYDRRAPEMLQTILSFP